ncbi:MAG TPA: S49 family peptidase, partial [Rhabdaerophilum sp.]|nr:S49 family peptidase [Rhabdaerophilum sp.]
FTGLFWTGKRGVELGLVDGLGDMRAYLKARFGPKTRLRLVSAPRGLFGRRLGLFGSAKGFGGADIGGSLAHGLVEAAEERSLWGRFGL